MNVNPLPAQLSKPVGRLLAFDTHPIQYRSPVFRELAGMLGSFRVIYFNDAFDSRKWWFSEVGKIPPQTWNLPLREGFESAVIHTRNDSPGRVWTQLRDILIRERPQAVLIYGYYQWEHWCLRLLCKRLGIALLFVGETFEKSRSPVRGWLIRFFFAGVDDFISIGTKTHEYYGRLGIPEKRLWRAKYCTDVDFFRLSASRASEIRHDWRESLGIANSAFVALFVGRLFERKRPMDLVAIHRRLVGFPDYFTAVVGNGELGASLREASRELPNFRLLGFQDQPSIIRAYHGADILLVPSEFETWGLVVNEAAACGLASIVTDRCGASGDLVVEGKTGYIVPVGDIERFAAHLSRLQTDSGLLACLGMAARDLVTTEYAPHQFASAIRDAVQKLFF